MKLVFHNSDEKKLFVVVLLHRHKQKIRFCTVVAVFIEGATAEEIVQQYPSLELADVYSVIGYYLRHKAEVDIYLQKRQKHAAEVRAENERRFNPVGIRDRLLARRTQQG